MARATLRTARLTLVPLAEEHLPYEIELDADPEVMRFLGNGRPRTAEQVRTLHAARLAEADDQRGTGFWVGFHRDPDPATDAPFAPGPFVGWWILGAPKAGYGAEEAELGYRLLPRWWRQGLAGEGARELLRHGFVDLGRSRIYAETMAVNTASRATMAAVGLRHVRTFHQEWDEPIPGVEHGEVEYALSRTAWDQEWSQTKTASGFAPRDPATEPGSNSGSNPGSGR